MTEVKTENMKKVTKRDNFKKLLNIADVAKDETLVKFIEHELELLDRKNKSENNKLTAKQIENETIKTAIVEFMEKGKRYTISDIMNGVAECAELTNQRVSALITQLRTERKVARVEEKRKAYFMLAE